MLSVCSHPAQVCSACRSVFSRKFLCVIEPRRYVNTGASLETFADACHALRALLLTHSLFLKVVTKDIWFAALKFNCPRIQTTWDLVPLDRLLVFRWKQDTLARRIALQQPADTGPAWAAPICNVRGGCAESALCACLPSHACCPRPAPQFRLRERIIKTVHRGGGVLDQDQSDVTTSISRTRPATLF